MKKISSAQATASKNNAESKNAAKAASKEASKNAASHDEGDAAASKLSRFVQVREEGGRQRDRER